MSFFSTLGIALAIEKKEQEKIDNAYKPIIKLAQLIDRVSDWLRKIARKK